MPNNVSPTASDDRADSTSGSTEAAERSWKRRARHITLNFTPSWFSVNMGTGITAELLHQLPYQFPGLGIIANVIFGINVVLFIVFLAISIARYTIWPTMGPTMLFHPSQSLFLGTFPMALSTIVAMCALSCVPAWGSGFATFTWILWWIDVVLALAICVGIPFVQFTRHDQSFKNILGIWFLPVVTTIVVAATGAIVADTLPPEHARLTLIVCWVLWGTGFPLAILLMALYYGRLAIYKIPPAALIVSAFLPLGPCGQGAFGLMKISETLKHITDGTGQALITGTSIQEAQIFSQAIYAVSIPVALVIWGLGLVWLIFAVAFLIDLALVQRLHFSLGFWGFTFPLGTFCAAAVQFGNELNSKTFRIIGTVLSLIETALWLYISTQTLLGAVSGKLFNAPCLAEAGGEPPKVVPSARKYEYEPRTASRSPNGTGVNGRSVSRSLSRFARSVSPAPFTRGRRR
jgi:C4-dicarboxylate transporter/malic acid transport protein